MLGNGNEVLGQSIRQGDHEAMASRVTFELEEQSVRKELSEEAAQRFQYLELEQNIFAQGQLRTVESALGTEYVQAQQNLQQQCLSQVQGLNNELQTAQKNFSGLLRKNQELEALRLRRELADKQQLIREQANDLQENVKIHYQRHANEEARAHEALATQASQRKIYCEDLTQHFEAERLGYAEQVSAKEQDISAKERDFGLHLSPKFAHTFPKGTTESEGLIHTGVDSQAMPTFAKKTYSGSYAEYACVIYRSLGSCPGKVAILKSGLRSWISILVRQAPGSVAHLLCRCIHHQVCMGLRHLLLLLPTLAQQRERQALHHKLAHNKVR